MRNISKKFNIYNPLLLAILLAVGIMIGFELANPDQFYIKHLNASDSLQSGSGRVEEVLRFIESRYVDDVNTDELTEIALKHVLNELDPHSSYISPDHLKDIKQQMSGKYTGIGIETLNDNDTLVIVKIMDGSPAEKSNLQLFDQIIKIDGKLASNPETNYHFLSERVEEEKPNTTLTIKSLDNDSFEDVDIAIDEISTPSTNLAISLNDSITYIKIKQFNAKVYRDFNYALEAIDQNKIKHIILDLRGNPGGYLPETAKILSLFFKEKDKMLVYTKDRNNRKAEHKSNGTQFYAFDKLAILVDSGSASGSEIMAGAVQDWDRGVIIGQPTFGKGLVQEQYSLQNGGAIRLTVARYFTPAGRYIQKPFQGDDYVDTTSYSSLIYNRPLDNQQGIHPDIEVDLPTDCPLLFEQGPAYTAYKLLKYKHWLSPSESNIDDKIIALSPQDVVDAMNPEDNQLEINETDPCVREFVRKVKYQMINLLRGEKTAVLKTIDLDPYLSEAMRSLSQKQLFANSSDQNLTPNKK